MAETTVTRNDEKSRYEIAVDGATAGYVEVEPHGGVLVLPHTEIGEDFSGQGLGTTLVRGALDDVRERGERIVPSCPFVAKFVEENPQYRDLVADAPGA